MKSSISIVDIVELFPRQALSIKDESTVFLHSLSDDFLTLYSLYQKEKTHLDNPTDIQNTCLGIIEKMQSADILLQRLSNLHTSLRAFEHTLKQSADGVSPNSDNELIQDLLEILKNSCHMEQEENVISDFLNEFEISP